MQLWHYGLPEYLSDQVEKIQKRALKIIFPGTTYAECLLKANLMTLYERRTVLCKRLFSKMLWLEPTHKLNTLVPPKNLQTYDLRSYSNLLVYLGVSVVVESTNYESKSKSKSSTSKSKSKSKSGAKFQVQLFRVRVLNISSPSPSPK